MATFIAYFDQVESHTDDVLVLAGCVASLPQWLLFEDDWNRILSASGLRRFQIKEFAQSQGKFKSWKNKEEKRKQLVDYLNGIIRTRVRKAFSCAVLLHDYRKLDADYTLREHIGDPYTLCARTCVEMCSNWARESGHTDEPIFYVFDAGARHKQQFTEMMDRGKLPVPIFGKKEDYLALQAAGLVAWEHLKAYDHIKAHPSKLGAFPSALANIPTEWGLYRAQNLEELCRRHEVPIRAASPKRDWTRPVPITVAQIPRHSPPPWLSLLPFFHR